MCKICLYLIENFKSSLSLIKVAWKNKRDWKGRSWRGEKSQKKYRELLKAVKIFQEGIFRWVLEHQHRTHLSCRAGLQIAVSWVKHREAGSKPGYQAGSIWNQILKMLVRAQTQKNVHLWCKSKSLQWVDTSLGKWATPLFCVLCGHLGKLKLVHVILFLYICSLEES